MTIDLKKIEPKNKKPYFLWGFFLLISSILLASCSYNSRSLPVVKKRDISPDTDPRVRTLIERLSSTVTEERRAATFYLNRGYYKRYHKEYEPAIPFLIDEIEDTAMPRKHEFCSILNPSYGLLCISYGGGSMIYGARTGDPPALNAIRALGKMGDARAVEPLIKAIKRKEYPLKWAVATALGHIGDPRAIEPILELMKKESGQSDQRRRYLEILQQLGAPMEELLMEALKSEDHFYKIDVVRALRKKNDRKGVEALIEALKDRHDYVRLNAVRALVQIGDKRATLPMIYLLDDEAKSVRDEAISGLAELRDPRAIEPLIEKMLKYKKNKIDVKDIASSLYKITGQNLGDNPKKWRKWWEKNKEKYLKEE